MSQYLTSPMSNKSSNDWVTERVDQRSLSNRASKRGFNPNRYSIKRSNLPVSAVKYSRIGHDQLRVFNQQQQAARKGPTRISLAEVTAAIDKLSVHQDLTVIEALKDSQLKESYEIIQTAAGKFYGTPHYHQLIIQPLTTKTVISLKPGTIGQFLFGGIRENYGQTTPECSPISIGAIPPNGTQAPATCSRQVWYYRDNQYYRLTDDLSRTTEADIYVPISFNGLSDNDINLIHQGGVSEVNIYTLVKDTDQSEISIKRTDTIPIDQAKANQIGKHLIQENEQIISRHQLNLLQSKLRNIQDDKQKMKELANIFQGFKNTNHLNNHQWVWAVLIFFGILIVAWIGYNIKNKN